MCMFGKMQANACNLNKEVIGSYSLNNVTQVNPIQINRGIMGTQTMLTMADGRGEKLTRLYTQHVVTSL